MNVDRTTGRAALRGFLGDIAVLSQQNLAFRRVAYTANHCQLVLMALQPGEDIGSEIHTGDQFFRIEAGSGEMVIDGLRSAIHSGSAIVVPAGARHNLVNTGSIPLKLYTLYTPPHHRDGVVHMTRADAHRDDEHFDGRTTELAARAPRLEPVVEAAHEELVLAKSTSTPPGSA